MLKKNKYSGTKTEKNLQAAFSGESEARNKYTYFASAAKKAGFEQIAALFLKTAENEKEHAKLWFKELGGIGDTAENLLSAAEGENYEWTEMYDEFAKTAEEVVVKPLLRLSSANLPAADAVRVVRAFYVIYKPFKKARTVLAKALGKQCLAIAPLVRKNTFVGVFVNPPPRHTYVNSREYHRIGRGFKNSVYLSLKLREIGAARVFKYANAKRRKSRHRTVYRE